MLLDDIDWHRRQVAVCDKIIADLEADPAGPIEFELSTARAMRMRFANTLVDLISLHESGSWLQDAVRQ